MVFLVSPELNRELDHPFCCAASSEIQVQLERAQRRQCVAAIRALAGSLRVDHALRMAQAENRPVRNHYCCWICGSRLSAISAKLEEGAVGAGKRSHSGR